MPESSPGTSFRDACEEWNQREMGKIRVNRAALDLPRLHRFLVEHGRCRQDDCVACGARSTGVHIPTCEWVALVEMTKS